jgi:hypothetical protein
MYYYAQRRCATRFTMIGSLLGRDGAARRRQNELIADLERSMPRLILLTMPPIPALGQFIAEHGYVYADRDGLDLSRADPYVQILCDPARPVPRIDWRIDLPVIEGAPTPRPVPPTAGGALRPQASSR